MQIRVRIVCCASILAVVCDDTAFLSNVWISVGSRIHLNGFTNRQTSRFLRFVPSAMIAEYWAPANGILSPYFLEDNENCDTVNQVRYKEKISRHF